MKKTIASVCGLFLMATLAFAQGTQPAQSGEMKKEKKPAKTSAPKSDAEIQKCITDKIAAGPKLKSQGFIATVSSGEATLTGTAANAGSKGAATVIAKNCGASKVSNNITAPPVSKPAKKSEKMDTKPDKKN